MSVLQSIVLIIAAKNSPITSLNTEFLEYLILGYHSCII